MYTRLNDELRFSPNLFTDNRNWHFKMRLVQIQATFLTTYITQTEYYCERGLQRTNLYQDGVIFYFFLLYNNLSQRKVAFCQCNQSSSAALMSGSCM